MVGTGNVVSSIVALTPPAASHRILYGSLNHQFADLRVPDSHGPHPVAIAIHGGFWGKHQDLRYLGHICEALRRLGIATWNIEYRRVGQEGGGWPGTLQDVGHAADHLRSVSEQFNLDLQNATTFGHSAGGHLALWLASRRKISADSPVYSVAPFPIKAAICINGVSDLRQAWELDLGPNVVAPFMGGTPTAVPLRYANASPAQLLPLGTPQIFVHGTADEVVPISMTESYCQLATSAGDDVSFVRLEGCGHFEPIDPRIVEGKTVLSMVLNAHGLKMTAVM